MDSRLTPRYPGYVLSRPTDESELRGVVTAAVARTGGRGALGPIQKGANILIVTNAHQDPDVLRMISEAMLTAGAAKVDSITWPQISHGAVLEGDFSAADGERELSPERTATIIRVGERVEQDALVEHLKKHPDYTMIYGGDAGEGHYKMAVGKIFKANWMYSKYEDLVSRYNNYPVALLTLIEQKLLGLFGRASEVRIRDPEGTDIGWTVTEEEAELWAKGAWIPWHMIGSTIEAVRFALVRPAFGGNRVGSLGEFARHAKRHFPTINGVISGTVNHTGFFPHIKVTVKAGAIDTIEGGGEYGVRFQALVDKYRDVQYPGYPGPGYHYLNDATIGSNPKTFRAVETLWNTKQPWVSLGPERYRAGVIHFGFGTEHEDPEFVKFGRENQAPVKHMPHIHSYFPTYEIKDAKSGSWIKVIEDGWLSVMDDPQVRRLAGVLSDPDQLLSYDWVPAMPGINYPGDYQADYAQDPVSWIRRDVAGEFGTAVK